MHFPGQRLVECFVLYPHKTKQKSFALLSKTKRKETNKQKKKTKKKQTKKKQQQQQKTNKKNARFKLTRPKLLSKSSKTH